MNVTEPSVSPKGRYSTNETCSKLGISRATLNRYRKAGLITAQFRKANFRPYYVGKDITRLWLLSV